MIVSLHLADLDLRSALRFLRRPPRPADVEGLTYAEALTRAPLGEGLLPRPNPRKIGLLAAWEDEAALDRFHASAPLAARLAGGWELRMRPVHVFGAWAGMPGLGEERGELGEDEPVAALTLGRVRPRRVVPFLRAAAGAEAAAVASPGLLASTGLGRPPLVSTFSIWRSLAAMKEYAFSQAGAHQAAVGVDRGRPFHRESAFVRFRPLASSGSWDGRDPLAASDIDHSGLGSMAEAPQR